MKKGMLILAAAAMALAQMAASARVRVGVMVGGPAFYAPGFYAPGYYALGWYSPFWGAYWGPGPYYSFPNAGEVKLDTKVKDAQVFINGSYAGTTKENKTMHLRPGDYKVEIKEGGQTMFAQQVYVEAGKTLHLDPVL